MDRFRYARQLHFLDSVPFEGKSYLQDELPIYPLFHAIDDNFLDATEFIGLTYAPSSSRLDFEGFYLAKEWLRKSNKNIELFNEAGFDRNISLFSLPIEIQKYHSSISLQMELFSLFDKKPEVLGNPVMFDAYSQNWKNDILSSTCVMYQKLRTYPYESRDVDMGLISSSRTLRLIYNLYNNLDNLDERDIAVDDLVSILFRSYFNRIVKRLPNKQD